MFIIDVSDDSQWFYEFQHETGSIGASNSIKLQNFTKPK
jgi:hypothetical protein